MVLTFQKRHLPASNDGFPTIQLLLLAICRVAEPIALTSILPYSWVMVKDFHVANEGDASLYAGILVSSFSLAEALSGMFWGRLSDRVGRKPVLLLGCFGTMLSLLLVGFAPTFWVALFGRVLGGALNGNIGVIQTMVGELVKNPEHEPRAFAVMPFVWSVGTIIGPAIGGLLANPAKENPTTFPPSGLFGRFPYLLPNLVCSVLLVISIVFGWLFLYETHPDMQPKGDAIPEIPTVPDYLTPLLPHPTTTTDGDDVTESVTYGTVSQPIMNQMPLREDEQQSSWAPTETTTVFAEQEPKTAAFTWKVSMLVTALAIFAYHSMTYDHLFPIFLQDSNVRSLPGVNSSSFDLRIPGGLGLSTRTVGLIMSSDGIIALFIQAFIFPPLATKFGAWRLFVLVTILHPVAYFVVPLLAFTPQSVLIYGIYTCLVIRNILSIIDYPVLLILIRQASPSDAVLGKVNGLAASASAAARTIAPPMAGYLYSTGAKIEFTALAWWGSTIVAILGVVQLWFLAGAKTVYARDVEVGESVNEAFKGGIVETVEVDYYSSE